MRRTEAFALAAVLCASVSACTPADHAPSASSTAPISDQAAADVPPTAPTATTPVQEAEIRTDQAGSDQATPAAARQVVIDYYAAIDARDYAKAYSLWSNAGAASGQSFEHFSGGYANTRSVKASVGEPVDEEGAAGSRFIQVPVELKALQKDGSERNYRGRFTLRAVMADGASEEQQRWHLASAEMQRLTD
jgi:hypothetical protein